MISLSYSRISLADIAQKLQLDSPEDAEFIVAKVGLAWGQQSPHSCRISGDGRGQGAGGMVLSGSAGPGVRPAGFQRECVRE